MSNIQLVKKSSNAKTGAIPVTTSSRDTCPEACPFNHGNGCYADAGYYTRMNWDKVTSGERGASYSEFLAGIEKIPNGQLWRHNVAGDLQGKDDQIDRDALQSLTKANQGKKGFTYTHYPMNSVNNLQSVADANRDGFTVNVSANNAKQAVELFSTGLPVVTVLPIDAPKKQVIDNVTIIVCPATYSDDVTCESCRLCSVSKRQVIVGFPAHGTQSKKAEIIARG